MRRMWIATEATWKTVKPKTQAIPRMIASISSMPRCTACNLPRRAALIPARVVCPQRGDDCEGLDRVRRRKVEPRRLDHHLAGAERKATASDRAPGDDPGRHAFVQRGEQRGALY